MNRRNIGLISKLRYFVNTNTLVSLYYALIYPFFIYSLIPWGNIYESIILLLLLLPLLRPTFCICRTCHDFQELLPDAREALSQGAGPSLISTGAEGHDTLEGRGRPQEVGLVNSHGARVIGQQTPVLSSVIWGGMAKLVHTKNREGWGRDIQ